MNRFSLLTCLLALLLGASACSSGASDSGIALGADGEATSTVAANVRGAIYVNTTTGDLLTVDPGRESAGVLWRTEDNGQLPVFEVAPRGQCNRPFRHFQRPRPRVAYLAEHPQ